GRARDCRGGRGEGGAGGSVAGGRRGGAQVERGGDAVRHRNPVDRADLLDRTPQVGVPRGAVGRLGEQRQPVGDRAFVVAGEVLLDREEIARARVLRVERGGAAEGFACVGRHRVAL